MKFIFCYPFNSLLFLIFVKNVHNSSELNEHDDLCLSSTCVLEASKIIQSLDESVSPCDDFYQFTCGQWIETNKIPDHKSSVTPFSQLQDVVNSRIRDILENIDLKNESKKHIITVKNYYNSCMNTSNIDHLDNNPLSDLLSELIDDYWPLMSCVNSTEINWIDLYIKLKNRGLVNNMLFSLSVTTDIHNNSRKVLSLDQPSFGLSRDFLLNIENNTSLVSYRKLMIKSVIQMYKKYDNLTADIIDSILQFEITLANISMSREQRRNLTFILYETDNNLIDDYSPDSSMTREERDYLKSIYTRKTINQLKKISPNIDWFRIIKTVISDNITESDEVILNDISFIKKLNKLLFKTNNRLIVNYMIWRVILSKQLSLSSDWLKMRNEFDFVIHGTTKAKPRWHQCIKTIESGLQLLLSHLYVKHYFDPEVKQKATEVIENVRLEFNNTLIQNQWIDEQTMIKAMDKLDKMKIMVGYPDQILNETYIEQYYEDLSLNSSDYFGNILKVNQWKQSISYNSFQNPNDIHDWKRVGSLTRANAFYNTVKNMVLIPAAILQGVFYNKDRPNYLNYGAIAKTAAHEIIHGFDSHGRHFDANGNFNYWWNRYTDQKYRDKAKCFVSQYSDYFVDNLGLRVNGLQTKAENIADNGGIKLAFRAYRNYVNKYGIELVLPALNYTSDQLFWISYGVHYCAKQNRENLRNLILNDSHTPKKFRINGALSNSEDFSKSFNCSLDSPMNPINKCSIW